MGSRHRHYLKGNDEQHFPRHVVFLDTETDTIPLTGNEEQAVLWFGWACYQARPLKKGWSPPKWFRFETCGQFWQWLKRLAPKGEKLVCYAHNMAFDFTVVQGWIHLEGQGWKCSHPVIESPPTILPFKKGVKRITFLCTLNYFRVPLSALGKSIGIDKKGFPDDDSTAATWDEYCRNDVEIIRVAMLRYYDLVASWGLGNYQCTQAAQAFSAFRHRFMSHRILIDDHTQALALSRDAYMGGRTECYVLGKYKGPFFLLDINSQYPSVMRENTFPCELVGFYKSITPDELRGLLNSSDHQLVAEVEIESESPDTPVRYDGRLIFPVGRFRVSLPTPELKAVQDRIVGVGNVAVYEHALLFRDFVDFFYQKRLEYTAQGDTVMRFFCKIFLNSLYGKFGQSGRKFEDIGPSETPGGKQWAEIDVDTGNTFKFRQLGGVLQQLTEITESEHSFPAIAAHVTSYARLLLLRYMQKAGWDNVLYCDTDSLLVNQRGLENLNDEIDAKQLGALAHEATFSVVEIRCPKDYTFDKIVKIKGIRRDAKQVGPSTFQQITFLSFKSFLQRGDMDRMVLRHTQKSLCREYRKGVLTSTGRVIPIRLSANLENERVL